MIENSKINDEDSGYGVPPEPRRVLWEMIYQKDDRKEMIFEKELALSALLLKEKVFLNNHWWIADWPDDAKQTFGINVFCNDVFMWGCSDSEELNFSDLQDLWEHHVKDLDWGTEVWCIKKRKQMPQKPVYLAIMSSNIWDLDNMNLKPNYYDSVMRLSNKT